MKMLLCYGARASHNNCYIIDCILIHLGEYKDTKHLVRVSIVFPQPPTLLENNVLFKHWLTMNQKRIVLRGDQILSIENS